MRKEEIKELFKDALREIMSIAVGKATSSLTEFLGKLTVLEITSISLIKVEKISKLVPDPEEILSVLTFKLRGDIGGYLLLIAKTEEMKKLAKHAITKYLGEKKYDEEFEESAIREIGNIFCSSFCTAIGEFMGFMVRSEPGEYSVDMAGAVLNSLAPIFEQMEILYAIRTKVKVEGEKISMEVLYLPDSDALKKISKVVRGVNQ